MLNELLAALPDTMFLNEQEVSLFEHPEEEKKLRRQTFLDELFFEDSKVIFRRFTETMLFAPCFMTSIKFLAKAIPSSYISEAKVCTTEAVET